MTSSVFADTYYFLSLLNRRDDQRDRALAITQSLRGRVVTSEWVLTELADGLADTPGRTLLRPFVERFRSDRRSEVVAASHDIFERAVDLYDRRADKEWSLTDCTSFVIMTDRRLRDALTGDHHFEQAGFVAMLR